MKVNSVQRRIQCALRDFRMPCFESSTALVIQLLVLVRFLFRFRIYRCTGLFNAAVVLHVQYKLTMYVRRRIRCAMIYVFRNFVFLILYCSCDAYCSCCILECF